MFKHLGQVTVLSALWFLYLHSVLSATAFPALRIIVKKKGNREVKHWSQILGPCRSLSHGMTPAWHSICCMLELFVALEQRSNNQNFLRIYSN